LQVNNGIGKTITNFQINATSCANADRISNASSLIEGKTKRIVINCTDGPIANTKFESNLIVTYTTVSSGESLSHSTIGKLSATASKYCGAKNSGGDGADLFLRGAGTSANPYVICNCSMLEDIGSTTALLNDYYTVIDDINCNVSPYNTSTGFDPIGDSSNPFTGTFNGNNMKIHGLFIDNTASDYIGLFGRIDGATITNVKVRDVKLRGKNFVGGLMGYAINSVITDSSTTGTINLGTNYVGGLAGIIANSATTVNRCWSNVTIVSANDRAGGLTGDNRGIINNSHAHGDVSNSRYIGGLVGIDYASGEIYNSYATGDMVDTTGSYSYGGALVGQHGGLIENCYATGSMTGGTGSGGLVGIIWSGTINNSFSTATVTCGSSYKGSITGWNYGSSNKIYNSYAYDRGIQCSHGTPTPDECTLIDNTPYFYKKSNPPLNVWDFTNSWKRTGSYPLLI